MTVTFNFSGKRVLVTGGSKGIGKSIAEHFVQAGAFVSICARGSSELVALQESLGEQNVRAIAADATKEEDVQRVFQEAYEFMGGIDILVNNVGGAIEFGDLWSLSSQKWQKAFELNVLSMVNFSKGAIPYLRKSSRARIINVSSISGVEPGFFNPHYTSTKASTINFSKYLANILASENILVNCVCPGAVETDSWEKSLVQIAQERSISKEDVRKELEPKERKKIPLGRMGKGPDIANFVLFLATDSANWITGSCFHLNGGKMRGMC